jgi:nucleoside-diphosphate-sugar epimerase
MQVGVVAGTASHGYVLLHRKMTSLVGRRLVIFGCGYVGTAVAREAQAAGLRVEALTRNADRAAALTELGTSVVVADLATDTWHQRIAPGPEFVLNCVSPGGGGTEGYRRSYIGGMRSILSWAEGGAIGTLVHTSSTSVYPQSGGLAVNETDSTDGAGDLGRILLEAEALLQKAGPACVRWFILRLAGIYGPARHHLLDQIRSGAVEMAGSGQHRLNLAHRDDIVAAVWAAFLSPTTVGNRVFNVADDCAATKAEIVSWLAAQVGRLPPVFSGGPANTRRGFGEPPDRLISNASLKAELGWRPKYPSYREGYTNGLQITERG